MGGLLMTAPGDSDCLRMWVIWQKTKWTSGTNENGFKSHVYLLFDHKNNNLIPNLCFLICKDKGDKIHFKVKLEKG